MSNASWTERLAGRFQGALRVRDGAWRRLGREAEYPVVHADGTAADIAVLWPRLAASGQFKMSREGSLVVALEGEHVTYSSEVGRGTIEIIVGPEDDLHGLRGRSEAGMEALHAAAEAEGLYVLGFGVQPRTPASRPLMTPKQRYGVLLEVIGDPWLWFSVTASDQLHVDVSRDEAVPANDLANLLSPLIIALCANSSVLADADAGVCSAREARMGGIHAERRRHGMPEGPSRDAAGWIGRTMPMPYFMHRSGGIDTPVQIPFQDWLAAQPDISEEAAFAAWLHHEHYVWNSARPRTAHGTVELRSACQQPWSEHMAAAALSTGILCGWRQLAERLDRELGAECWPVMRSWHSQVVADGLAAPEPIDGLVHGVLTACQAELERRGRGEEVYLEPLWRRWERRQNPAQFARSVLAERGMPALIDHLRVR
jgi:glutamate--cysteine ligase